MSLLRAAGIRFLDLSITFLLPIGLIIVTLRIPDPFNLLNLAGQGFAQFFLWAAVYSVMKGAIILAILAIWLLVQLGLWRFYMWGVSRKWFDEDRLPMLVEYLYRRFCKVAERLGRTKQ